MNTFGIFVVLIGSLFIFFGVIIMITARVTRRRMARERQALLDGESLAHWHYTRDEWIRFTESEWQRERRVKWADFFAQVLVLGVVVYFFVPDGLSRGSFFRGASISVGFGTFASTCTAIAAYVHARLLHRARLRGATDAIIGRRGVYCGKYIPWTGFGISLGTVKLDEGHPSVLEFELKLPKSNTQYVRVPVPHGHEHQAREILKTLA